MPSTGNPWLERNQREEKVAVKQSQALHHQMPFIHTLLLSIFLFFLLACLSSCGRKKTAVTEKSLGQLVWSRTVKPDRPALFSPPLFWQTFALRLSSGRHLGFGNANQRKSERGPGTNGGRERMRSLGATRQSESLWQRQTTRHSETLSPAIDMHK